MRKPEYIDALKNTRKNSSFEVIPKPRSGSFRAGSPTAGVVLPSYCEYLQSMTSVAPRTVTAITEEATAASRVTWGALLGDRGVLRLGVQGGPLARRNSEESPISQEKLYKESLQPKEIVQGVPSAQRNSTEP